MHSLPVDRQIFRGLFSQALSSKMFAKLLLTDEERAVDPQLGYPRGYAKLCRHAHFQLQGLITPFTDGPPQRFLPYAPLDQELAKLKEMEDLFPITAAEKDRNPTSAKRHAEFLWQQLDHLGNAGFDPAKFRVDVYGNVLYWNADPASPLAWEVDHWFPHSRGGKTVPSNLRVVQWQAEQCKGTRLEFLVPWWDLQVGISVNQFLSVFASTNADFRQRAFSLFFSAGENEQLDDKLFAECHQWPQHFRERKDQVGMAASALVRVQKDMDDALRILNGTRAVRQSYSALGSTGNPAASRWTLEEEEALQRAMQKFGPGNWKNIKESEPALIHRSILQIKDKYLSTRGEWQLDKENKENCDDKCMAITAAIQREGVLKKAHEEEMEGKKEEIARLGEELRSMRTQNEKEKLVLDELEHTLAKQKKRVEKQRRWSETQSQYRLCLERMIRDTMHQCVVYKEQARLSQAACNALLARLESQKSTCDAAEMDFLQRVKQRESLEAMVRPRITKRIRNIGHTDVGSCIKPMNLARVSCEARHWPKTGAAAEEGNDSSEQPSATGSSEEGSGDRDDAVNKAIDKTEAVVDGPEPEPNRYKGSGLPPIIEEAPKAGSDTDEPNVARTVSLLGSGGTGVKRKATEVSGELDVVLLGYEYGEQDKEERVESVGENASEGPENEAICIKSRLERDDANSTKRHDAGQEERCCFGKTRDEEHGNSAKPDKSAQEGMSCAGMTRDDPAQAGMSCFGKTRDEEQLDELLTEVLEMQGKVNAAMADAIQEEEDEQERVKKLGKLNLDKWLQKLLLDPNDEREKEPEGGLKGGDGNKAREENRAAMEAHQGGKNAAPEGNLNSSRSEKDMVEEHGKGGIISGILRRLSFKQEADMAAEQDREAENSGSKRERTKEKKREESKRISPWRRSITPTSFKRSDGSGRGASPGRRKSMAAMEGQVADERRMMESFSRLRVGAERRPLIHQAKEAGKEHGHDREAIKAGREAVNKTGMEHRQHDQRGIKAVNKTGKEHHHDQPGIKSVKKTGKGNDHDQTGIKASKNHHDHHHDDQTEGLTAAKDAEEAEQIECETEFVKRMRERERRRRLRHVLAEQRHHPLQEFMTEPLSSTSRSSWSGEAASDVRKSQEGEGGRELLLAAATMARQQRSRSTPVAASRVRQQRQERATVPHQERDYHHEQQQPQPVAPPSLVDGGGAVGRKRANALMRSASTARRLAPAGPVRGCSRSSSAGPRRHAAGSGHHDELTAVDDDLAGACRDPSVFFDDRLRASLSHAGGHRDPPVFFDDRLRASLSHAWTRAVQKFDLART